MGLLLIGSSLASEAPTKGAAEIEKNLNKNDLVNSESIIVRGFSLNQTFRHEYVGKLCPYIWFDINLRPRHAFLLVQAFRR